MEWLKEDKSKFVWSIIFALMNVLFKLIPYFIIGDVIKRLIEGERHLEVYVTGIVLIALSFIISEIFRLFSTSLSHKATFAILANIRKQTCDKLVRVPLGYVKDQGSGTFKNIIVERIDSMETTMAHIIPELTSGILAPIIMLVYFFIIDWRIALFSFIPVILGLCAMSGMMIGYEESFQNTIVKTKALNDAAVEYINGIEVIKAFGKAEKSYDKFVVAAKEGAECFIEWMRRCNIWQGLSMTLTPYTLLTVLPVGALFVKNGSLSPDNFVMCIILALGIIAPLLNVMGYMDDVGKMQVIFNEVINILEHEELTRPEKTKKVPVNHSIKLTDVIFGYHEKEILHGIDMDIEAGTVNAIVGPSGSGKSTIAKLIASMWDINGGKIEIGQVNIKDISLDDYNQKIAYVSQDNYLFDDTIMENIRMGKQGASDEEVIEVAKKSGCYDFIMNLEHGFDTVAGGAGGHLSGGERQRISIARAMLKNAPIIIFDEATAYTDPENEAIIQSSIAKLIQGKTLIVIAHRLSTIVDADQIFVIDDGMVVEKGNHEELLQHKGIYQSMWKSHISVKDSILPGGENNA